MIGAPLGVAVKLGDRVRQRRHQLEIELAARRQSIEQRFLIEAAHLDHPVNGVPDPPSRAIHRFARDRDHSPIERARCGG